MKAILLAHGSAGDGHRAVANALKNALELHQSQADNAPKHNIIMVDALSFASPSFRLSYHKGYEFAAQHLRGLVGFIYGLTDQPLTRSRLVKSIETRTAGKVSSMLTVINENKAETVCCTHFLPVALLAGLRRKGLYKGSLHVCVTDYQAHGFWVDPEVDQYYVAGPEAAQRLADFGVKPERIQITGIPTKKEFSRIDPVFSNADDDLKILFSASSLKKREAFRILREIGDSGEAVSVTMITGRNQNLLKSMKAYQAPGNLKLELQGYVGNMEKLMADSNLIITKPGGIISTEALCAGRAMLFVAPIPRHEVLNASIIADQGAGLICFKPGDIKAALNDLSHSRHKISQMHQACRNYARPDAALVIAKKLMETSPDY